MKRSRKIELAVMGSVPLLLAACDQPPPYSQEPVRLYQSLQECVSDGKVAADVCQKAYDQALQAQARSAPQYGTYGECAAQYGYEQCHRVSTDSGSVFIPALAGFLLGRALDRHDYGYGYAGGGYGWMGRPIYRYRGDRAAWRTSEGERFGAGARGPSAPSTAETLSRGGFGYSGAARGSWGG